MAVLLAGEACAAEADFLVIRVSAFAAVALVALAVFAAGLALLAVDAVPAIALLPLRAGAFVALVDADPAVGAAVVAARFWTDVPVLRPAAPATDRVALTVDLVAVALAAAVTFGSLRVPLTMSLKP